MSVRLSVGMSLWGHLLVQQRAITLQFGAKDVCVFVIRGSMQIILWVWSIAFYSNRGMGSKMDVKYGWCLCEVLLIVIESRSSSNSVRKLILDMIECH